jgi:hypothetical protein
MRRLGERETMRLGDREMGRIKDKRFGRRFPSRESLSRFGGRPGVGFRIRYNTT